MPTYEYVCDACGHQFEEFQSIKADALTTCPSCKEEKLRRLIGAGAALIFKGSGFYQTDYRSEGYKKAAKSDKESSGGSSSKSESSTPAKSDSGSSGSGGSGGSGGSSGSGGSTGGTSSGGGGSQT